MDAADIKLFFTVMLLSTPSKEGRVLIIENGLWVDCFPVVFELPIAMRMHLIQIKALLQNVIPWVVILIAEVSKS